MEKTFPEGRELSDSERLRIFEQDKAIIEETAKKIGVEADEVKRRAIHVGLPRLAELLGIKTKGGKAA